MKDYKLHVPEGFKDTFGKEMLIKNEIENRVLKTFDSYGFINVKSPLLEYVDLYSENGIQKPDLYNLINKQGEVLALSNDMTKSIARFVATSHNNSRIQKYCYISDTLRYPTMYQGKNHQFLQAGIELIGKSNEFNDVEAIFLAYKTLKNCGVNNFTIHLGSSDFLHTLFNDFKISDALQNKIIDSIDSKDYVTLKELLKEEIDDEKTNFIVDLMLKGGHVRYIESLMLALKDYDSYMSLMYLKNVFTMLKELNVDNIIFDFSVYSYAKYYTGIVFSIYVDDIKKSVVSGGRCDNLLKTFGLDKPDVGFGMDIDAITTYCMQNDIIKFEQEKYLSQSDNASFIKAMKNNDQIRDGGIIVVDSHLDTLEEALAYAKEAGFKKVLDYKDNKVRILEVK